MQSFFILTSQPWQLNLDIFFTNIGPPFDLCWANVADVSPDFIQRWAVTAPSVCINLTQWFYCNCRCWSGVCATANDSSAPVRCSVAGCWFWTAVTLLTRGGRHGQASGGVVLGPRAIDSGRDSTWQSGAVDYRGRTHPGCGFGARLYTAYSSPVICT